MNEVRTREKTAILMDALNVVRHLADSGMWSPALDQAIAVAVAKGAAAHACAVDDDNEDIRYRRHTEMMRVAAKYYAMLKDDETPPAELKTKLDILQEPFSDDPAFVAFLRMRRAVAGLD